MSGVVEALWTVHGSPGERMRLLADACTDLIALDDRARRILFNGPMTVAESTELHFPVTTGLWFRPGVLAEVVPDLRLDAVLNADLEVVNPREGENPAAGLTAYVRYLLDERLIHTHATVDHVLGSLAHAPSDLSAVYRSAYVSERTIQRLFLRYVGVSPRKTVQILRQNDVGRALRTGEGTIAELSSAHGYSDQAHMTRQFGALAGVSPGRFLRDGV